MSLGLTEIPILSIFIKRSNVHHIHMKQAAVLRFINPLLCKLLLIYFSLMILGDNLENVN